MIKDFCQSKLMSRRCCSLRVHEKVFEQCDTKQAVYGGIVDGTKLRENLLQNCIPEGFENMDIQDYPMFQDARRVLMAGKIKAYYFSL